jgi:transcriptional regulator with XRE-family HTH domain
MKDPAIIAEIERLLAEGVKQREIARRLHVWRGLVADVAAGKRPDYEQLRRLKQEQLPQPPSEPCWCSACSAMVQMPCVACRTRQWMAKKGKQPSTQALESLGGPLGMQLKEEHQRRYEEVRARKLRRLARRRDAMRAGRMGQASPTVPTAGLPLVSDQSFVIDALVPREGIEAAMALGCE